ncbi:2-oxo-3-deoxygalactonate kinase [Erwinia sp. OLTSP20]|uniref:2-dehydro-3-deoxygalactonokinase n=1 Tax=unclassified Erwinia TaxID=2622719 RepID=UPI000C18E28B|nr:MULTISPECIES: 2-dehydro-3-deoxygalactonokinase [unclassified Erwinia]PIJ49555.1 2-oxo-3-deoxygalactonate kinase [Erwinia sp. OAMSP11]PIJ72314.1 2-oxo-3-deoxygalactonate kinase [Erwinia sp. OLSSP12]PIJ81625.1 2-oxo-3-deoxygalactonate kinase [Erwinia sp. OLMDSP33]PIJ81673.1 2-oxo-3-deoxygalactonate kinase [Erwinia sp. OLCASP19]PIJ82001.1 2-oxo-3-deoxygalactonate kinase [Erwinia sp. OLMTSP26]
MSSYIAIDWGSTNLRAWYYRHGQLIDERRSEAGVTRLEGRTPLQVFNTVTADWPVNDLPVVMAGMVGSNAGWLSVPYLPCPVSLDQLASHLTRVEQRAWIVPGLKVSREDNYNIIRGEETQLLGASELAPSSLYVMPGTHAKWVVSQQKQIVDFRTVMTGEMHHLLLKHALIGAGLPQQKQHPEAFRAGLITGSNDSTIIARLFEVRARHVLGALAQSAVSDYLSGLLIGHEVASQLRHFNSKAPLTLIAGKALAHRYQQAFELQGVSITVLDGDDAFQQGIRSIAHELAN